MRKAGLLKGLRFRDSECKFKLMFCLSKGKKNVAHAQYSLLD